MRRSASSFIELPAMKPATQAIPCSASTSPFLKRIRARSPASAGQSRPGTYAVVGSGRVNSATAQTAMSRQIAIRKLSANQRRSTGPGCACQRSSVPRVSRIPWTRT